MTVRIAKPPPVPPPQIIVDDSAEFDIADVCGKTSAIPDTFIVNHYSSAGESPIRVPMTPVSSDLWKMAIEVGKCARCRKSTREGTSDGMVWDKSHGVFPIKNPVAEYLAELVLSELEPC